MPRDPFEPLPPPNIMRDAWAIYRDRINGWRYRFYDRDHRHFMSQALRNAWDARRNLERYHHASTAPYLHLAELSADELRARLPQLHKDIRELGYYSRLPKGECDRLAAEADFITYKLLPYRS